VNGSGLERGRKDKQGGTIFHAVTPLQNGSMIEKENGKNDGRTIAVLKRRRKRMKRSVCVS
jgi:hypothetical protein